MKAHASDTTFVIALFKKLCYRKVIRPAPTNTHSVSVCTKNEIREGESNEEATLTAGGGFKETFSKGIP